MIARLSHLRAGAPCEVVVHQIVVHCGTGNRASSYLQSVLYNVESGNNESWTEITHPIPAEAEAVLVVVAVEHARASLMGRIATTVLAAVDDRRRCPKTRKAGLGIVVSASWNHLVAGQAADFVALSGDKFLVIGHPDVEGMWLTTVGCTQLFVMLCYLLTMTEIQMTMTGEMAAADWWQRR